MTVTPPAAEPATAYDSAPFAGSRAAGITAAILRIALGFTFLWAFLDKLFGLNYATPSERAWINGGPPTRGFLSSVDVGPLEGTFHSMAGKWWADWLFMLGLAGLGIALILGIGMRIAAVAGIAMVALMWLAEFPPAQHTSSGEPSGSSNPIVNYHFVYAAGLAAVAAWNAGRVWGLGRMWERLPTVRSNPWLR
jgi:thiosulfate dehydrogenase [quinone] large subunit